MQLANTRNTAVITTAVARRGANDASHDGHHERRLTVAHSILAGVVAAICRGAETRCLWALLLLHAMYHLSTSIFCLSDHRAQACEHFLQIGKKEGAPWCLNSGSCHF
jgi:hypothetical protein